MRCTNGPRAACVTASRGRPRGGGWIGYRYQAVAETDPWLALCTTHTTWQEAVRRYRKRWATEGSYRDAPGGWDGQHGWDLEPVLTEAPDAGRAERLLGLWALGALVQTFIGAQVQHGPAEVRATAAEWTTTGRLSVWAHGQFALREPKWPLARLAGSDPARGGRSRRRRAPPCGRRPAGHHPYTKEGGRRWAAPRRLSPPMPLCHILPTPMD